jgi:hypothetical protein
MHWSAVAIVVVAFGNDVAVCVMGVSFAQVVSAVRASYLVRSLAEGYDHV